MFSVLLRSNHFSIRQAITDVRVSYLFLHRVRLIPGLIPSRNASVQFLVRFCSASNLCLAGVPSTIRKRGNKFAEKFEKDKSYTLAYLINSCGLSPQRAVSVAQEVCFWDSQKPDSVLALLEKQGFSKPQIASVVWRRPQTLLSEDRSLSSKFEILQSLGVPRGYLPIIFSNNPKLFGVLRFENRLVPNYKFFKSLLVTDENVTTMMKIRSWVFLVDVEKGIAPNIDVLMELQVPESGIQLLLKYHPEALIQKTDDFKRSVDQVLDMGFTPSKSMFVIALHAVSGKPNKVAWARCYETYSNWGWSKDDIYMAFRKQPHCMLLSEKKLSRIMDFLVNNMGCSSRLIARWPVVLSLSLEKRIVPRCSVIQLLKSRDLLIKEVKLTTLVILGEKRFLENFVLKYEKDLPGLHSFYKGKIGVEDLLHCEAPE